VAAGTDGDAAIVSYPRAKLKSLIAEGATMDKIRQRAGECFHNLFRPAPAWFPVEGFRDMARSLLGKKANPLIRETESRGVPQVRWETRKPESHGQD
jgi:hypothetical protein